MSFADTALQMVVLAIPIIIGYVAHKLGFMGGDFDSKLSGLVVNITLPAMIIAATFRPRAISLSCSSSPLWDT